MIRVGEEVEQQCTTCRVLRGHVVMAVTDGVPAALICRYCGKKTTSRRAPQSGRGSQLARPVFRRRASIAKAAPVITAPDPSIARPYRASELFSVGDTIRHPSFGLGVVEAIQHDKKIHVRFGIESKVLVAGVSTPE